MGDHKQIPAALIKKDARAAKLAMWQHLENVKQRLLEFSNVDDIDFDGYLFDSGRWIKLTPDFTIPSHTRAVAAPAFSASSFIARQGLSFHVLKPHVKMFPSPRMNIFRPLCAV